MDNKEYRARMYKMAEIREALTKATEYEKEYQEKAEKYAYLVIMLQEDRKRLKKELQELKELRELEELEELEEGAENAKS